VTYRVEFDVDTALQFHTLPTHAREALFLRVAELSTAPWDGTSPLGPASAPAYREAVFGNGYGLLVIHVDDTDELIRILDILWID
jgi:hypothetical protein